MSFHNKMSVLSSILFIVFVVQSSGTASTITKISAYSQSSTADGNIIPKSNGGPKLERNSYQISTQNRRSGNVIFNDSFAFSSSSEGQPDSKRNTRNLASEENVKQSYSSNLAGSFLRNHRLNQLPPEVVSSAAAVAASSHFISPTTNSKLSGKDDIIREEHVEATGGGGVADATQQGRSFVPGQYFGGNGQATAGSCLFSCGGFGGGTSCCPNYVQCCPNPQQELLNFKNLHHGRGHLLTGGGIDKSGYYGWGSPPYNPPPIVRPKPCQPFPYNPPPIIPNPGFIGGGGSIIHKGIETLKHGVGQLFKDHGGGWTSAGNAAYWFHRRSDNDEKPSFYDINSSKKKRLARSVHKGFDQVGPCPVYGIQPQPAFYGWPIPKPQSVGLGSLIGWTKPVNQIHGPGYFGGAGAYGYGGLHHQSHGWSSGKSYGWGAGLAPGFGGPRICKWDYDCPGIQKCCKGICDIPPQIIH